jgi:hypothetical protein
MSLEAPVWDTADYWVDRGVVPLSQTAARAAQSRGGLENPGLSAVAASCVSSRSPQLPMAAPESADDEGSSLRARLVCSRLIFSRVPGEGFRRSPLPVRVISGCSQEQFRNEIVHAREP